MKANKKIMSAALAVTLCSTSIVVPSYADEIDQNEIPIVGVTNDENIMNDNTIVSDQDITVDSSVEIEAEGSSLLEGLDTRGINPALSDNIIKSLLTDNFTVEDAKILSTLDDEVLLEGTFNNQYYYTSQRFNTSTSAALGSQINIYLVNTGSRNIRMYTTRDDGVTMESAVVRPGSAQLFTIDNYDILYYGTQMLPGYTALSYYVHADTIDGGPISFTLRIKHYDV